MDTMSLHGEWTLYYHLEEGDMPDSPEALLRAEWPSITARVPGNVELDLHRAGIEDEPFFGENLYRYTRYEYYQWWFCRTFELDELAEPDQRCMLCFEGLDTFGTIFINGKNVGSSANMFVRHEFDITPYVRRGRNEIAVRIASPMNAAKTKDYPVALSSVDSNQFQEMCWLRKAPHSFGWDIMPRFLSAGIWRDVFLEYRPTTRIQHTYLATVDVHPRSALLCLGVELDVADTIMEDYAVRFTGQCRDHSFSVEKPIRFLSAKYACTVETPYLWWPRGLGPANLYTVTTELLKGGDVIDSRTESFGIRTVEIDAVYDQGPDNRFDIRVNGRKLLALGTNWVPLDAFHSRDAARLDDALAMVNDLSCNIVRCWGGNVYEDHPFYDFCDRHGILVWQDFALACAIYPQTQEFYQMIREEVASVVKKLRNHPSIALWAGDNEIDEAYRWNHYDRLAHTRHNNINREIIPGACRDHDPYRFYIPSSPFYPDAMDRREYAFAPERHIWGPRDYFKGDFYQHNLAAFISETGYHGCPAASSLKKYIAPDKLWPCHNNSQWDTHNTDYLLVGQRHYNRIQLMTDQVETLFGEVPDDMERYILASQISQAEAKKYFIERVRIRRNRMGGVIWWNLLDGWPQISDAVVDYYFMKKIAYHYIKRSQQPVCVMMDEFDAWHYAICVDNNTDQPVEVALRVTLPLTGEVIHRDTVRVEPQAVFKSGRYRDISGRKQLFVMEWEWNGVKGGNHYISGYPPYDLDTYVSWLKRYIENLLPTFHAEECIT